MDAHVWRQLHLSAVARFSHSYCIILFSPSLSRYVHLLRVPSCSSHLPATLSEYVLIVRVLSFCVIRMLHHLGIPLFVIVSYFFVVVVFFLGWRFCCALVPGTLALKLPILIISRLYFFGLTFCHHIICNCISLRSRAREDTAGTADVVG